ncbi:MAG: sensor domain-containing protein [Proteobacteria bacterium]|uniref:sensor domain-containing protein n=1 Tax=Rudaea sp. TaxID=2136325 RepID=UPI001DE10353|nr:sensor domain-containing protein [Pseudomonadota bacterium]MBS0566109.1 sensor domain-containing protein [Pseudomonadota bacterium]
MTSTTPRTIADYLEQLRSTLQGAGADPALIQDALYDAEEHLRAELHENPGKSEAEVLAKIVGSYGAPEEVAGIYVDKEVQVQQALRAPRPRPQRTAWGRFFAVGSDARTYAGLFYMLLSLATGIFYFTWTVVGLSLSLGLSVLIFGVVFAVFFFATTRVLALVESRIVETMLGERMPRRPVYARPGLTLWQRMGEMFTDPRTWSTLLYFVLMLPLGIVYFTIAVTGIATSLACIFAPIAHIGWMLGLVRIDIATDIHFNDTLLVPWQIADPLVFVIGVALLFGLLHFARGLAKFQGALAKSLLVKPAA